MKFARIFEQVHRIPRFAKRRIGYKRIEEFLFRRIDQERRLNSARIHRESDLLPEGIVAAEHPGIPLAQKMAGRRRADVPDEVRVGAAGARGRRGKQPAMDERPFDRARTVAEAGDSYAFRICDAALDEELDGPFERSLDIAPIDETLEVLAADLLVIGGAHRRAQRRRLEAQNRVAAIGEGLD